mgnify:FL=1
MSLKNVHFQCVGTPDDPALKTQLSSIPGVVEMDIDARSHAVDVLYDDTRVSNIRIEACLNNENYRMQS